MKSAAAILFAALSTACTSGQVPFGAVNSACESTVEACFLAGSAGGCSLDPSATCANGTWQCGPGAVLGRGCAADGGILRADAANHDAGERSACTLGGQVVSCASPADCTSYGATCVLSQGPGPGECACVAADASASCGPARPDVCSCGAQTCVQGSWGCVGACARDAATPVDTGTGCLDPGGPCPCGTLTCEQGRWTCVGACGGDGGDASAGCEPACGSSQVCVTTTGHLLGSVTTSCEATPTGCSGGLDCTCAAALCAASTVCASAGSGQVSCQSTAP